MTIVAISVEPRAAGATSLSGLAATIARSARDVAVHTFEIAALESRLAAVAAVSMVAVGLGILVLALSAWGLLIAAGVGALIETGMSVAAALLLAAAVSLVAAGLLALLFPWLARRMNFSATRRALQRMGSDRETKETYTS